MPKFTSQRSHAAITNPGEMNDRCDFCGASHLNYRCSKLNTLSAAEKIEKVRSVGACFNCLRKGHRSKDCPSSKSCRKCQKRHHTQLHEDESSSKQNSIVSSSPEEESRNPLTAQDQNQPRVTDNAVSTACSCNLTKAPKTVLLLTAVVLALDKNEQPHKCRVLLDCGSQVNFLTERMANTLGLERTPVHIPIADINNVRTIRDAIRSRFSSNRDAVTFKQNWIV